MRQQWINMPATIMSMVHMYMRGALIQVTFCMSLLPIVANICICGCAGVMITHRIYMYVHVHVHVHVSNEQ